MGSRTEITYHDVTQLKYCSSIFKEALRLFPPAPQLDRKLLKEITINGFKVPAYSQILVNFVSFSFYNGLKIKKFIKLDFTIFKW